jgi:hypothetical protein
MSTPSTSGAPSQLRLHFQQAQRLALNLFSYSQACVWEGVKEPFQDEVITQATEFALHARRVSELSGLLPLKIKMPLLTRFGGEGIGSLAICDDYHDSLNRLVHSKNLRVNYIIHPERPIFGDTDNLVISFLEVDTDRRAMENVSLFAISACFLTDIRPRVLLVYGSSRVAA